MKSPMDRERLRQRLEFYSDLGFKELYRRPAPEPIEQEMPKRKPEPAQEPEPVVVVAPPPPPPPPSAVVVPVLETLFAPADLVPAGDTLKRIQDDIGDCRRCRLCEQRNKIVFSDGSPTAPLVFVGEGPGADEDAQGLPFVGRAGQLLTQMIEGTARKEGFNVTRQDVYICNVVKCRPPENRTPQPDEMETCGPFLERQLRVLRPKAIVALGSTAAKYLLKTRDGVTKLRGNWYQWNGIQTMVTYHPSYLLRQYNQNAKREAWEDLKKVLHFVYD